MVDGYPRAVRTQNENATINRFPQAIYLISKLNLNLLPIEMNKFPKPFAYTNRSNSSSGQAHSSATMGFDTNGQKQQTLDESNLSEDAAINSINEA